MHLRGLDRAKVLAGLLMACAGPASAFEFTYSRTIGSNEYSGEDIIVTSCTVTIDCSSGFTNYRSLLVRNGGRIRTSTQTLLLGVTGDATVEAGSSIDVSYAGHAHHAGPGAGGSTTGTGATHGGTGGGTGAWAYGSVTEPTTYGSGGGCTNGDQNKGGLGGGAAHVRVGGMFTLNGSAISMANVGWNAGGGAGGSLWIEAGTLAGAGVIAANGGNADTDGWPAYGGGGGRVAVTAGSSIFSGSLQARGGTGPSGNGGPGSVYFKDTGGGVETVTFDNNGAAGSTLHNAFQTLTADMTVATPTALTVSCSPRALEVHDLTIASGASLACPANDGVGLQALVEGDLLIASGAVVSATGCGYPWQQGPGRGHYNTGDGGTYGGTGSKNSEWWAYGDVAIPSDQGSGGGSNNDNQHNGGSGGGRLSMHVTGQAAVLGVLSSDGAAGFKAGGGSGGSVILVAGTLTGDGVVRANGGAATGDWNPAGGGGGRVAVVWGSSTFTGSMQARGGEWSNGGTPSIGGPGTVYTRDTTTQRETARFDSGSLIGTTLHHAVDTPGVEWFIGQATVVFNCAAGVLTGRDMTVLQNGTVTCPGNDGMGLRLALGRDLTIDAGGSVTATGCGYPYQQGPGRGHYNTGDGGTYGGAGGRNGEWWAYGSVAEPAMQGSGGGSNNGNQYNGGSGGGILTVAVGGATVVNGSISSDGAGAWKAGGGSGGSVSLRTVGLGGTGSIHADGGAGSTDGWSASGGGGGRVAVVYAVSGFLGSLSAHGGVGVSSGAASNGGPGSVYLGDETSAEARVTFDNLGIAGYTLHPAFSLPNADMTVGTGDLYFGCTAGPLELHDLTVQAGTITCPGNDGAGLRLIVTRNLTVATGGAISVSGRGYPNCSGPGGGHYNTGDGGTYGGQGGKNWIAPYGSLEWPGHYGSGGGNHNDNRMQGGAGGGLLRLAVKGDMVVDGSISADGYGAYQAGGGSGGTLRIACGTVSGTGVISARGGSSTGDWGVGGGGGGRIAIRRAGGAAFAGGTVTAAGGSGQSAPAGGAGTVYWGDSYAQTDLLLVDAAFAWNADGTGLAAVTLCNAGLTPVFSTRVGAYTGVPGAAGTVALGSAVVADLLANETVRVSVPVMAGVKVTSLYLVADPDNTIAEGSEANNTVILTVGRTETSVYVPDRSGIITTTVALKAYLKRLTDNAWLSGKPLSFKVAGTAVGSASTDAGGQAVLNWTIGAGAASRALRSEFAGDTTYNPSAGNATLTAQTVATKVYVVDRTAKIKSYVVLKAYLYLLNNTIVAAKPMTMKLDGTELGTSDTNPSGYIQFGYTVPEGAGAGVRTIRAEFAGDAGYNASANNGKLTVTKASLYLWPYVRSAKRGTNLPLKAYVRSLPDYVIQPGKGIAFSVNGTAVDTGVVAADGWATVTWAIPAGEATGSHTATAAFAGDDWYLSASANTTFNVVP
ncbi:MAG: Ig-like domain-containing protein [Armatimonadetes bacterium]|nr:Ig-like domain-containing protein [Armatimonadota bacterium]